MQKFLDELTLDGVRTTADGYLVADAHTVRTGIQLYAGYEVGKPELKVVRVYRPEGEVFHRDSLRSFSHAPVTLGHPKEPVTKDNWGQYAVGEAGEDILRDGERAKVPLIVKDSKAIDAVKAGTRELSAGYNCELVFEDGKTPSGEPFDAYQKDIRINHIAIVPRGRAGPEFRFGDEAVHWGAAPLTQQDGDLPMQTKTVMVDGLSVETTEQGAQAISKLQTDKTALAAENIKLVNDHAEALKAKDKEIATKDAEIDALKAKQLTDAQLDALVTARADIIGKAKAIVADFKADGLSIPAIRRAVVVAKLGDAAVKDKSDDYVEARFDLLVDAKPTDQVRETIMNKDGNDNGRPIVLGDADTEYRKMLERDAQAWKMGA